MTAHLNTIDLVRALRQTLGGSCAEFEAGLRKMPAGDGPIFVVGDGAGYLVAQTAALSFETLTGRPCLVRTSTEFSAYTLSLLRPHAPVLVISLSAETQSAIELFRMAQRRGAWLMLLTNDPRNPLIGTADHAFVLPHKSGAAGAAGGLVCAHAASGALGVCAGRIFKPPSERHVAEFQELRDLPEHLDHVFSHSSNAVQQIIEEMRRLHRILILGCGFFRPVAAQAVAWMGTVMGCPAQGGNPDEFPDPVLNGGDGGTGIVLLSGSQSPHKKLIHHLAEQAVRRKCLAFAITDAGDFELIRHTRISLLVPALHEMAAALLQLATVQWMASLAAREPRRGAATPSRA